MRVLALAAMAALTLSCGADPEPGEGAPAQPGTTRPGNRPPVIGSVKLVPPQPTSGDTITLDIKTMDPDNDAITLHVEFFRNGNRVQSSDQVSLSTFGFPLGDRIHASVTATDGEAETAATTEPVMIVNQHPRVSSMRLVPEKPQTGVDLTVLAEAQDVDGDEFELRYEWTVNGKVLDNNGPVLEKSEFKRGDEVQVSVYARDAGGEGQPMRSTLFKIPNGAPDITSDPSQATVGSRRYRYVIKGVDPDGDRPLRYTLVEGPDGMTVDLLSGLLSWRVPEGAAGGFRVTVGVSDPLGAETQQSFSFDLHWETAPANAD